MKYIFAAVLSLMSSQAPACNSYVSAPGVISAPGTYCLSADISVSTPNSDGIAIIASNVTLDLQGHSITGPGSGYGSGISAYNVSGLVIRNGKSTGFLYGVRIENSAGSKVQRMDVGANSFRGVRLFGSGGLVEQIRVKDILGYAPWPTSHSMGIEISGPNCVARSNIIDDVMPYGQGEGVGISVSDFPTGCQVYDNLIRFSAKPASGRTLGIWAGGMATLTDPHGNVVLNADYGLFRQYSTPNAIGNHIHQRCPVFWSAPDYAANNYVEVFGGCTDPEAGM